MDQNILEISRCFKYTTEMDVKQITLNAVKILNLECNEYQKNCFIIMTKPLDYIYDVVKKIKKKNPEAYIYTDCRFFAMFISNLLKYPRTGNLFMMNMDENTLEINVPDICLYITLDRDIFRLKRKSEQPQLLSQLLKTEQGNWITKIEKDKYIGICSEGILTLTLNEWVEKYKKNVQNYIELSKMNRIDNKLDLLYTCYNGILDSLCQKHGICVSAYKFKNQQFCDTRYCVIDILKEQQNGTNPLSISSTKKTISV